MNVVFGFHVYTCCMVHTPLNTSCYDTHIHTHTHILMSFLLHAYRTPNISTCHSKYLVFTINTHNTSPFYTPHNTSHHHITSQGYNIPSKHTVNSLNTSQEHFTTRSSLSNFEACFVDNIHNFTTLSCSGNILVKLTKPIYVNVFCFVFVYNKFYKTILTIYIIG